MHYSCNDLISHKLVTSKWPSVNSDSRSFCKGQGHSEYILVLVFQNKPSILHLNNISTVIGICSKISQGHFRKDKVIQKMDLVSSEKVLYFINFNRMTYWSYVAQIRNGQMTNKQRLLKVILYRWGNSTFRLSYINVLKSFHFNCHWSLWKTSWYN